MKHHDKEKKHIPHRWVRCSTEEEYMGDDRKEAKKERKMAGAKDRSKYKKTDRKKYLESIEKDQEAKLSKLPLVEGRVLSIIPQGIMVETEGKIFTCILKGLLKKEKTQAKNLVTVGDFVLFEKLSDNEGIIAQVKPRKSFLSRADNLSRRKEQLIAANIDQVLITASIIDPLLKPPLIDRYIIATRKGNMEPLIILNKIDLLQNAKGYDPIVVEQEKELYHEFLKAYEQAGIPVIAVSTITGEGLDHLRRAMQGKASVFSGQSGTGKSSLINAVTGLDLRVGETVERTKKGSHTTTTTQLIPLEFGGWCVDTPGIKSFGVWDLQREDIDNYFQEIREYASGCKFQNCTHSHEDKCAVIQAFEDGKISPMRYMSYQVLMQTLNDQHLRR